MFVTNTKGLFEIIFRRPKNVFELIKKEEWILSEFEKYLKIVLRNTCKCFLVQKYFYQIWKIFLDILETILNIA